MLEKIKLLIGTTHFQLHSTTNSNNVPLRLLKLKFDLCEMAKDESNIYLSYLYPVAFLSTPPWALIFHQRALPFLSLDSMLSGSVLSHSRFLYGQASVQNKELSR